MLDVIIIGAGHAGLAASYCLKESGLNHLVLERGRVGESWRSQRWTSFALNTPNWCSLLPGDEIGGDDPDSFYDRDTFVSRLESYQSRFNLPVKTGIEVVSVTPSDGCFRVSHRDSTASTETLRASNIIVASGIQNVPLIPDVADQIPASILQLHAADYRVPAELPGGGVLVVGSGQSGCQIAEDLLQSGRRVYLSTSKVARIPRRYRGRDVLEWFQDMGVLDARETELPDPSMKFAKQPQVSGTGPRGHTVSLQQLAREGAVILGRLSGSSAGALSFAPDAKENVLFGDQKSAEFKEAIDAYIARAGLPVPPLEEDPNDEPDPKAACASPMTSLDAAKEDIRSIIWCTGFTGSFDWIDAPVFDDNGQPLHKDGASSCEGLFFLGFPWLRKRKSGIVAGITDDARYIVSRIIARQRR